LTALCEKVFGSVGQKAEVTHAHEAFGDHVEQKPANEFVGIEGHGLFSVLIFSVSVPPEADQPLAETEGNLSVMG
jgi:hypothetical protein